jgi:hypothetical protein
VVYIPEGDLLTGTFPAKKLKLVQAWINIHEDELMANWQLATEGSTVFKIDALK